MHQILTSSKILKYLSPQVLNILVRLASPLTSLESDCYTNAGVSDDAVKSDSGHDIYEDDDYDSNNQNDNDDDDLDDD